MDMQERSIQRIRRMERILDTAGPALAGLEQALEAYEALQPEIRELEAYYTGPDWRQDLALDEAGRLPSDLRRGVLSQDGIFDLLERDRELRERLAVLGSRDTRREENRR